MVTDMGMFLTLGEGEQNNNLQEGQTGELPPQVEASTVETVGQVTQVLDAEKTSPQDEILSALTVENPIVGRENVSGIGFHTSLMAHLDQRVPEIEGEIVARLRSVGDLNNDTTRSKLFTSFFSATDTIFQSVGASVEAFDPEYVKNPVKAFLGRDVISEIEQTVGFLNSPERAAAKAMRDKEVGKSGIIGRTFGKVGRAIKNRLGQTKDGMVDGLVSAKDALVNTPKNFFGTDMDLVKQLIERKPEIDALVQQIKDFPYTAVEKINLYMLGKAQLQALRVIYNEDIRKHFESMPNQRDKAQYLEDLEEIIRTIDEYINLLEDAKEGVITLAKMSGKVASKMELSYQKGVHTVSIGLSHGAAAALLTSGLVFTKHMDGITTEARKAITRNTQMVVDGVVDLETQRHAGLLDHQKEIDKLQDKLSRVNGELENLGQNISTVNSGIATSLKRLSDTNRGAIVKRLSDK